MQLPALSFHSKKKNKQGIRTCLPVVSTQKMAQFPKSSESGDGRVYGVEGDGRERAKMGVAVDKSGREGVDLRCGRCGA
jgi:hypothetical protein